MRVDAARTARRDQAAGTARLIDRCAMTVPAPSVPIASSAIPIPATPFHVPSARASFPVPRLPSKARARSGPVAGRPDISAGTPSPEAPDPEIPRIRWRTVILHAGRGWCQTHIPAAVIPRGCRCNDAASQGQRETKEDRHIAQSRSNTEHVNLIADWRGHTDRLLIMNAAPPPRCTHRRSPDGL